MSQTSTGKLTCIPRIVHPDTETVILGTFPSRIALERNEYYGNPKNHFWEIMGFCLGIDDFENLSYEKRMEHFRKNKIGIWDAIHKCRRDTSSDAKIEDEEYNDLSVLRKDCPNIRRIVLSSKFMLQTKRRREVLKKSGIDYLAAPSPSRRYIISLDDKKRKWKKILFGRI